MAYDIAMNVATNDLILENGDLIVIDNAERVAQQILISLRFWAGEWFLRKADGVPYLERILVKNPNLAHVRQIITEQIKAVPGVKTVTDMTLDFDQKARTRSLEYEAATDYGLLTRTVTLGYGR